MLLVIDNYDSFTYNLVQYFASMGADVQTFRNDEVTVEDVEAMAPDGIVISPGPCTPDRAGVTVPLIRALSGRMPILGVCLGHQSIGAAFGARIVRARRIMHGKVSKIEHDGRGVFRGLRSPLTAGRYHSLVIDESTLPDCLEVTARAEDGEIMGVRHVVHGTEGIQFHPESVLTPAGKRLLANFLAIVEDARTPADEAPAALR